MPLDSLPDNSGGGTEPLNGDRPDEARRTTTLSSSPAMPVVQATGQGRTVLAEASSGGDPRNHLAISTPASRDIQPESSARMAQGPTPKAQAELRAGSWGEVSGRRECGKLACGFTTKTRRGQAVCRASQILHRLFLPHPPTRIQDLPTPRRPRF